MKERALQLVHQAPREARLNVLREYLQAHILFSLQSARAFEQLAFVGGSALRFLHGLCRFSEDLDFSLERPAGYDLRRLLRRVERELAHAGFDPSLRLREKRTVHGAWIGIAGILHEAGLSPHRTEKLSIRVEIDTDPPSGAQTETTLVHRHFMLSLLHYDLPSLMAGKLHALLSRPYTKGRDMYDLLWYLSRSDPVAPNVPLLQHALRQTGWDGPEVTVSSWADIVADRIRHADFRRIVQDVDPLLERSQERTLLSQETVLAALRKASG